MTEDTINEKENHNEKDNPDNVEELTPEVAEELGEVPELAAPEQEVAALRGELETWQAQAAEYLDGWQRSRAEFANYKKRVDRETAQAYQSAAGNIFKRYLEVLDDLERALKNRPPEGDGAAWAEGIELVYRKFTSILEAEGVKVMQAQGQTFDPNLHEAISQEENDEYESGQIIEVIKQGYLLGERVLRPALVRIAR